MAYWLMKSEPDVFSFDDLVAKGGRFAELARAQFLADEERPRARIRASEVAQT